MPTSGPIYGGSALQPGVTITNITTNLAPHHAGLLDVVIEMVLDTGQIDVNGAISALRNAMQPQHQPGHVMTTGATSSYSGTLLMVDDESAVPLPDEDSNGNGVFDANEELVKMIEKRFDDVDQALRLLVDP